MTSRDTEDHHPAPGAALWPLLFVLLWSTGFIGARYGLPYAPPLTFLALRYAIVIVIMLAVVVLARAPWPGSRRAVGHIAVSGLLIHGVYLGGVFIAIDHGLPAGVTALVVGVQPLITALLAGWLFAERVSPRQWLGLGLGFLGVALVVQTKITAFAAEQVWMMLLPAVVALLGITAGTLYQKRFCPAFDLRSGAVIQYLPCLIGTALLALAFEDMVIDWSADLIFALAWLVLVLSIGAISLLNMLISRGSAVNLARLFYLTPVSTALIAWAMFDERLGPVALAGMGLAASGVWLARR
ncbi:DMT family transporter [Pseudogemmobacter hezensis]|uniref:DMT family transporter n=1 Tax=Pseudogemmobacter hezensis TaxID=2737662 RepID=UPI00345A0ED6